MNFPAWRVVVSKVAGGLAVYERVSWNAETAYTVGIYTRTPLIGYHSALAGE